MQDAFLVVDCRKPFRVHSADKRWLRRFGFKSTEAEGRSIRICFGPETDTSVIDALIERVVSGRARETAGVWSKVRLYDKCGDVQHVLLQAQRDPADDEQDAPIRARLRMRSNTRALDGNRGDLPCVGISSAEPYPVLWSNQAFLDMYGIASSQMIQSRGVKMVWGPCTDGRRWKALIQEALAGNTKTCELNTYTCEGHELSVYVSIGPDMAAGTMDEDAANQGQPCRLVAFFMPVEEEDDDEASGTTNSDSASSGGLWEFTSPDSSQGSSASCTDCQTDEASPTNSDSHEVALHVHLRALRLHKFRKSASSGSLEHMTLDPESALRHRLKSLTTAGPHSRSFESRRSSMRQQVQHHQSNPSTAL